jgi:hypothetical protein
MRENTEPENQDLSVSEVTHLIEVDSQTDALENVQDAMIEAIGDLLETEGLEFPCHLATIGSNGWGSIVRYTHDGGVITLAEHDENGGFRGFRLPIHCLLMDSNGWTARLIVRTKPRGN